MAAAVPTTPTRRPAVRFGGFKPGPAGNPPITAVFEFEKFVLSLDEEPGKYV